MIPKPIIKSCLLNVMRACKRYGVDFNDLLRELNVIKEDQPEGGSKNITCPKCKSTNVEPIEIFDYVKQCKDCNEQFSTGIHN